MKNILLMCLCIQVGYFGITPAYADDPELFKPLSVTALSSADEVQNKFVDQIKKTPTTESVNLVNLDINALSGNTTRMSLPNANVLYFNNSSTDVRNPTDITWIGTATNDLSKATLVVHDGNITGTIRDASNLYRIEPIGNGVHAIIKVNESRFPPDHPPSFKTMEKSSKALPNSLLDTNIDTCPEIDVLVAYTTASRNAVFDIAATIQLAVAETNQSYVNSGINIRLNLVDTMEVDYAEGDKSYTTILEDFATNTDVNNRRDNSGADMAVMIINQDDYCGMAEAIMANAENAYAVVNYKCATGYYTFAHELGHLQGARHDPDHDWSDTPFAYGHGFQHTSSPSWRTIMAYDCVGHCPRIPYWSNPNVIYEGYPMGSTALNDNARVLNGTSCTVAGFRTRPALTTLSHAQNQKPPQTGMGLKGSLLTISLNAGGDLGKNADWWLVAMTPWGHWYSYVYPNMWVDIGADLSLMAPAYRGPLTNRSNLELFDTKGISSGGYVFYFGVDTNQNDKLDYDQLHYSSFSINVP